MGRENMNNASSGPLPYVYDNVAGEPVVDADEVVPVCASPATRHANGVSVFLSDDGLRWMRGVSRGEEMRGDVRCVIVAHVRSRGNFTYLPVRGLADEVADPGTNLDWSEEDKRSCEWRFGTPNAGVAWGRVLEWRR